MASIGSLVFLAALCGNSDTVLLNFYSDACGPCRTMAPVVQRLADQGLPVRRIDVAREPKLAEQHRVTGIPCFIMISNGQVVDRVDGSTSIARLERMFKAAQKPAEKMAEQPTIRGQSPEALPARPTTSPASRRAEPTPKAMNRSAVIQRAMEATVRIKVDEANGISWGTGTIVDVQGDEALIVTCGHVFRDSNGRGRIEVDLFAPGAKGPVPGHLIGFEAKDRDIGLIAIRPGIRVQPVSVASPSFVAQSGDPVFSIGCDKGGNPSVRTSHVTSVDKYLGAPNVEVAGQPVDGRSGGGLFSADGQLFGICNAADPQDDEGVYASWPNIHWQLEQVGLQRLFDRPDAVAKNAPIQKGPPQNALAGAPGRPTPPRLPSSMPATQSEAPRSQADRPETTRPNATRSNANQGLVGVPSPSTQPASAQSTGAHADTEIIFIVRSRSNPQGASQTFVVNQPSADLMHRLRRERDGLRGADDAGDAGPIIRAQSAD